MFFGGGTPSRLAPATLCRILDAIPRTPEAEVTVECNPEDADDAHLGAYRAAGVTRVSFGLQSTNAHVLAGLGRRHVPDAAARRRGGRAPRRVRHLEPRPDLRRGRGDRRGLAAHAGRGAGPAQPAPAPQRLRPHRRARARPWPGRPTAIPTTTRSARRYEMTDEILSGAGYGWEEISNWARPGHRCRHNQLYWDQGDYVGIGSAAHSHRDGVRWWNMRTPDRYIDAIEAGRSARGRARGAHARAAGLRGALAHAAYAPRRALGDARPAPTSWTGWSTRTEGRAVLTVRGRLLANEVTTRITSGSLHR